ncbi:hypothetical protein FQN60_002816 [Etheostoma spectabile]|uniref:Uncharacterized protein n=1 Tax=Etheostoma spectabile TaxID=54343 RepID=A0A5J5CK40_9PERO|nr:hypothetical protein FQN60_002816 [Etheostoma spectabile]
MRRTSQWRSEELWRWRGEDEESHVRVSQLVAVDVILKHGLLHVVTDHGAEGTHSVALLVLLQFVLGYAGEALLAVTTHQRPLPAEIETASSQAVLVLPAVASPGWQMLPGLQQLVLQKLGLPLDVSVLLPLRSQFLLSVLQLADQSLTPHLKWT